MISYKEAQEKIAILINNIEAGYVLINKQEDTIEIKCTYIYPGFRENGYALKLIKYIISSFSTNNLVISCPYFKIMFNEFTS